MSQAFWDWSLNCYDEPDVREAALALQDDHDLNVNILLWCCWLAGEGRDAAPCLPAAISTLEPWSRDITRAIRETRKKLKSHPGAESLYKAILACELDAEHIEQDLLFELASDSAESALPPPETALGSLRAYGRLSGVEADFTDFVKAVFPGVKKV